MRTHELLREEQWTSDNRRIVRGAISWPLDPLPVYQVDEDGRDTPEMIGTVVNIRREGDQIFGDSEVEMPEGKRLTCAINIFKAQDAKDVENGIEVVHGSLSSAHVSDLTAWPWED